MERRGQRGRTEKRAKKTAPALKSPPRFSSSLFILLFFFYQAKIPPPGTAPRAGHSQLPNHGLFCFFLCLFFRRPNFFQNPPAPFRVPKIGRQLFLFFFNPEMGRPPPAPRAHPAPPFCLGLTFFPPHALKVSKMAEKHEKNKSRNRNRLGRQGFCPPRHSQKSPTQSCPRPAKNVLWNSAEPLFFPTGFFARRQIPPAKSPLVGCPPLPCGGGWPGKTNPRPTSPQLSPPPPHPQSGKLRKRFFFPGEKKSPTEN